MLGRGGNNSKKREAEIGRETKKTIKAQKKKKKNLL